MEFAMSDIVAHQTVEPSNAAASVRRVVARLARAIDRALFAQRMSRELETLPDRLRRDIGLIRMALATAIAVPVLVATLGSSLI
jgi:uncharacterized protein YjiS (DUF1127 family)